MFPFGFKVDVPIEEEAWEVTNVTCITMDEFGKIAVACIVEIESTENVRKLKQLVCAEIGTPLEDLVLTFDGMVLLEG